MGNLKKDYAFYLKRTITQPDDWNSMGMADFPPGFTSTKRYCEEIVLAGKSTEKIEAIFNFFDFNGEVKDFPVWIAESNKTKAIENFFRKEEYIPIKSTLEFIARLFDASIKKVEDYKPEDESEKELVSFVKSVEEKDKKTTSPIIEVEEETQIEKKNKTINLKWLVAASVISISLISFLLYSYNNVNEQNEDLNSRNEELSGIVETIEIDGLGQTLIEEHELVEHITEENGINESVPQGLIYHTNNIYNSGFIVPKETWDFPVDAKGEDINSEFGAPFSDELKPLFKTQIGDKVSIANLQMLIRFNIKNNTEKKYVIDNIYLKRINVFAPKVIDIYQNAWSLKQGELSYKVELNKYASWFPFTTLIELEPGQSKYFSMNITGDPSCMGAIFKYRIVFGINDDVSGKKIKLNSDKDYMIGFFEK